MDIYLQDQMFLHSVAEVLHLQKPIYEFGWEAVPFGSRTESGEGTRTASLLEGGHWGRFEVDRLADLAPLPFPSAIAQTVLCLQVLDQVADPVRTVQEMERILMPGGVLVVAGRFSLEELSTSDTSSQSSDTSLETSEQEKSFWPSTPRRMVPQQTGFIHLLGSFPAMLAAWLGRPSQIQTLYAVAKKAPLEESFLDRFSRLGQILTERFSTSAHPHRNKTPGWLLRKWQKLWSWLPWPIRPTSIPIHQTEEFSLVYMFSFGQEITPKTSARMSASGPISGNQ